MGYLNSILLVVSGIAALAYGAYFVHLGPSFWRSFIKTLAVGCLAALAYVDQGLTWLFWSLAFGAAGDMFLTWRGEQGFRLGLASFALGHLCLTLIFLESGAVFAFSFPVVGLLIIAIGLAIALFRAADAQKFIVVGYCAIIGIMGALALGLPEVHALALWAALLFVLSDAVLGSEMFLLRPEHPARSVTPYVIWATYYAAQLMFFFHFTGAIGS